MNANGGGGRNSLEIHFQFNGNFMEILMEIQ